MPRVALCAPAVGCRPDSAGSFPTLGLLYLRNAALGAGWECTVVDAHALSLSPADAALACFSGGKPDLVGFAVHSELMLDNARAVASEIRGSGGAKIPFVAGGVYASACPEQVLLGPDAFDFVVHGEGEKTLWELLECLRTGLKRPCLAGLSTANQHGELIRGANRGLERELDSFGDLDWSPLPQRPDLFGWSLVTSRGCPGNCSFCLIGPHWGAQSVWRGHSAAWIIRHLEHLALDRGASTVQFVDDSFIGTPESIDRASELVGLLRQRPLDLRLGFMCRSDVVVRETEIFRQLRDVGLRRVFLGLENGCDSVLTSMGKRADARMGREAVHRLTRLGIEVVSGTIVFHPWMTMDTLIEDLGFFRTMLADDELFFFRSLGIMDVFSNTPMATILNTNSNSWLVPWSVDGPAGQVLEVWKSFCLCSLFPLLRVFPPGPNLPAWRSVASLQLNVLEKVIEGAAGGASFEDLVMASHAFLCRYVLQSHGVEALSAVVSSQGGPLSLHDQELCLA